MSTGRLVAVIFIFCCVTVAWLILGGTVTMRTEQGRGTLSPEVEQLWGSAHEQRAPLVTLTSATVSNHGVELDASDIAVDLQLQQRRKGLLWFATYGVAFAGNYTFTNDLPDPVTATVTFEFPASSTIYDDFEFRVNDETATPHGDTGRGLKVQVKLQPNEEAAIRVAYKSRGLESWRYSFGDSINTVKDFRLIATTDFDDINFPGQTISASTKTKTDRGWQLEWQFTNLVSDFAVGVEMPQRLNPGPLASKMSYFAPVSLLFFFTVLVVFGAVKGINLHPMHYFFLGAAFFAFHLLFAYLVDHMVIELAFALASLASLALVISYVGRVVNWRFAWREVGLAQLFFLVLFSYAFFFEGYTGLVVTLGAVITLAVLMQTTARVDWAAVFKKKDKPTAASNG